VKLSTVEREHGGLKVTPMGSGRLLVQVHSYGSMENVSISLYSFLKLMVTTSSAGAGKSIIWYE